MISHRPFRAFVSYCHADAAFAARLQRKLEAYRLPRRLADRVAPLPGQAPGRIGPVFRDREDLSAAADLSEAVREAIALSSALVVVASPDAAKSVWVEREIALFREHHPQAPILVALARGQPAEALPAALCTGAEPLAADFRPEGDGVRLAFLKIVAGLAGLPLDALVQRDAQRQVRRVTAVTLGAGALVVVMAVLLVVALRARSEADRRRQEAEGLVEYMLTDLRRELKGVGSVRFLQAVNARAMRYYQGEQALGTLPDDSLTRRARLLHAMGEDEEKVGELRLALPRFIEARRVTAAILARRPNDADALFAHAQSEYWVGYVGWQLNDLAIAREGWSAYAALAERLARAEPNTVRSLMELGYSSGNLCELSMRDKRDVRAALGHCRRAVAYMRDAVQRAPTDTDLPMKLANRLGWLADVLIAARDFAGARRERLAEMRIVEDLLHARPDDLQLRERSTWPVMGLGSIAVAEKRAAEAVGHFDRALNVLDALSARHPENQHLRAQRIRANLLAARALWSVGDARWRAFRNRGAAILETSRREGRDASLARYRTMLAGLDKETAR